MSCAWPFLGAIAGDTTARPRGVAIPLTAHDGLHYVAHILPLTTGARRQGGVTARASAAVFVHKAALGGPLPLKSIEIRFRLTPAELRVLVVVIEIGGTIVDMAQILGLSEPTVKSHLRKLYEKTGTKRQADLVRLVAGHSNPLVS